MAHNVYGLHTLQITPKSLPLLALKHAMVVTDKIEGMNPSLPNVRDHDLSVYLKTQGDSLSIGGYEQNPEFWHNPHPSSSYQLFDIDWDTFAQNLNGHIKRCPAISYTGIKSTVCGPEAFTSDHKPLLGPQPGTHGYVRERSEHVSLASEEGTSRAKRAL